MGKVHLELPEDVHTDLRNIKNNDPDRPGTIEGCGVEAIEAYVEEHWRQQQQSTPTGE